MVYKVERMIDINYILLIDSITHTPTDIQINLIKHTMNVPINMKLILENLHL